jgi:hypothetical protein
LIAGLENLQITGERWDLARPESLPTVTSFTLKIVSIALSRSLLSSSTLPSLQDFSFVASDSHQVLLAPCFQQLLPQLQLINLDIPVWLGMKELSLKSKADATLLDFSTEQVQTLFPRREKEQRIIHVRLYDLRLDDWDDEQTKAMDTLIDGLSEGNPPLRSIYLDSSLCPSALSPKEVSEVINRLVELCRRLKIDLTFESMPQNHGVDPEISPGFSEKQRKLTKYEE